MSTDGTRSSSTSVTGISSWWEWIPTWLLNYDAYEETENEGLTEIGIVALYTSALSILFWVYWTCE